MHKDVESLDAQVDWASDCEIKRSEVGNWIFICYFYFSFKTNYHLPRGRGGGGSHDFQGERGGNLRWPTTVTAKQKVTALQTLLTAKQNLFTAKQRKRVGQRLLFPSEMVCRVIVTHCSLEKSPFFELAMFCCACGSVVDEDANFCKSCGRGTFLNLKCSYLHFF